MRDCKQYSSNSKTTANHTRQFLILVFIICVLIYKISLAGEMVPFVIPAKPNPNSLIADVSYEPIRTGSNRLLAKGSHFYRSGERVRLWGVNLSFGANMPKHEDATHIAARLATAGVNTVRCHHMDTARWPRGLWNAEDGKTISPEALDRLDFFIYQLSRHGICININLHVGRAHSEYLGLPKTNRQYDKISNIFTPALIDAQKQFARQLLTHVNPYREVRYADDPAVALVEITNENSFFMWASENTLRTLAPYYADILQKKYNTWLKKRYGSDENLKKIWAESAELLGEDPLSNSSLRLATPGYKGSTSWNLEKLSGDMMSLQKGESIETKSVAVFADIESPKRILDRMQFLAETEKAYFDGMRNFIKRDLDCKALVTGTIVFGPLGLYTQSDMDFIDTHAYWQHPRFPGRPWDRGNWIVEQKPMTDNPAEATLFRLASCRLEGKPFTLSEYNHPAPLDSQAECVPMAASFAAAQDWDAVWLYTYSHSSDDWYRENLNSYFDIDTNPAKWGFMRAGAAIFREGLVQPLGDSMRAELFLRSNDLVSELVQLHLKHDRNMMNVVSDICGATRQSILSNKLFLSFRPLDSWGYNPPSRTSLRWSVENGRGVYYVGSGAGVLAGDTSRFERCQIDDPAFAVITATPLDGLPWPQSSKILITACGRCENTGMEFSKDRRTVGRQWGHGPVQIETVKGTVEIARGNWTAQALGPDGLAKAEVPVRSEGDRNFIEMLPKYKTMWYLLVKN